MTYEDRPFSRIQDGRKYRREKDRDKKNTRAHDKILKFFASILGLRILKTTCNYTEPDKIYIARTDELLTVQHRGGLIQVLGQDIENIEGKFREWAKTKMSHAKVFPRTIAKRYR